MFTRTFLRERTSQSRAALAAIVLITFCSACVVAQPNLSTWLHAQMPMSCGKLPMTMRFDVLQRPYLFVAQKTEGLTIYDLTDSSNVVRVAHIGASDLGGSATSMEQRGTMLYIAVGDIFIKNQVPGVAAVDVSDPLKPVVMWKKSDSRGVQGAGGIAVDDSNVYLAAMGSGLIIWSLPNEANEVHTLLLPERSFPEVNPDTNKYNVRGVVVREGIAYVAFDAGGLRMIDVSDPQHPFEIGRYSNPSFNGRPRAYNNVALIGNLVFVTVDYCGLEILNVSNPSNIVQVGWWNPWECPNNNWFTSTGHTNEIVVDSACGVALMSTGRSDMYAVDISNPQAPVTVGTYGNTTDTSGTWGITRQGNKIALSYICTLGIPFASTWAGVKVLGYSSNCIALVGEETSKADIYPSPFTNSITIHPQHQTMYIVHVVDMLGNVIITTSAMQGDQTIDLSKQPIGCYNVILLGNRWKRVQKVMKWY